MSAPPIRSDTPQRIDVRPVGDRRAIAQWTRDAFDVRCLGTIGGLVGLVLGFFIFAAIGGALNVGPVGALVLGVIGLPIGFYLGVRVALGTLAR